MVWKLLLQNKLRRRPMLASPPTQRPASPTATPRRPAPGRLGQPLNAVPAWPTSHHAIPRAKVCEQTGLQRFG